LYNERRASFSCRRRSDRFNDGAAGAGSGARLNIDAPIFFKSIIEFLLNIQT
jgi:hypothetical protein